MFLLIFFLILRLLLSLFFFFFNDPAPPEIFPFSLHDALPISPVFELRAEATPLTGPGAPLAMELSREVNLDVQHASNLEGRVGPWPDILIPAVDPIVQDRKSTRLNSSHLVISYAASCLKKKKH